MEKAQSNPSGEWLATQKALMSAIGFTEDDLEANRAGQLSESQKVHFRKAYWRLAGVFLFWALMWLLLVIGFYILGYSDQPIDRNFWALTIFWSGVFLYFGVRAFRSAKLERLDASADAVQVVKGKIGLREEYHGEDGRFLRHIVTLPDGKQFVIPPRAFEVLEDEGAYAIYYARRAEEILSIEPLLDI